MALPPPLSAKDE
ncbi:unnamed protein product, partial [Adineta steineri]